MPSLIDLRRRVRSIRNTQQITKAMKMVSAARLRRAQDRVINSRPYARMFASILSDVAAAAAGDERVAEHPLLAVREERNIQLVLVTADRGLAGAYNTNLIRAAEQFVNEHAGQKVEFELYGRKGRDYFVRRDARISGELAGASQTSGLSEAKALADKLMQRFADAEIDSVYILYNEFKSVLTQRVTLKKILPLSVASGGQQGEAPRDYIYEQPPAQFLGNLLPRYVLLQVLEAFLENTAAEHAARMTAMDAATNNASDVMNKLTLYINRVRQAGITNEIIEVVSGAAAQG
ncbi:MAG: ATP synthase F1 subunit gamma [Bryobacteraceae bacterium]|nr:ATP synthase F1 subunit gamma [Bryobacteraceae bacterium]